MDPISPPKSYNCILLLQFECKNYFLILFAKFLSYCIFQIVLKVQEDPLALWNGLNSLPITSMFQKTNIGLTDQRL